jgi:adenosylcobinamide kinase/adenosylcobinamide-phosphate guanylyltransferase
MIVVTGGSRSGKSSYAERLANDLGSSILYIATAAVTDEEMEERIKKHRERRPETWETYEGYRQLDEVFRNAEGKYDGILLDCVTTMVTNLMFDELGEAAYEDLHCHSVDFKMIEEKIIREFEHLSETIKKQKTEVILVTNELGMGIVPETLLGRVFRDIAGRVNQIIARHADSVYLVVSGIDLKIK